MNEINNNLDSRVLHLGCGLDARYKSDDPAVVIQNWMRNRDVIEFLGLWERLHNPDFNPLEFEEFKKRAGSNAFPL